VREGGLLFPLLRGEIQSLKWGSDGYASSLWSMEIWKTYPVYSETGVIRTLILW